MSRRKRAVALAASMRQTLPASLGLSRPKDVEALNVLPAEIVVARIDYYKPGPNGTGDKASHDETLYYLKHGHWPNQAIDPNRIDRLTIPSVTSDASGTLRKGTWRGIPAGVLPGQTATSGNTANHRANTRDGEAIRRDFREEFAAHYRNLNAAQRRKLRRAIGLRPEFVRVERWPILAIGLDRINPDTIQAAPVTAYIPTREDRTKVREDWTPIPDNREVAPPEPTKPRELLHLAMVWVRGTYQWDCRSFRIGTGYRIGLEPIL